MTKTTTLNAQKRIKYYSFVSFLSFISLMDLRISSGAQAYGTYVFLCAGWPPDFDDSCCDLKWVLFDMKIGTAKRFRLPRIRSVSIPAYVHSPLLWNGASPKWWSAEIENWVLQQNWLERATRYYEYCDISWIINNARFLICSLFISHFHYRLFFFFLVFLELRPKTRLLLVGLRTCNVAIIRRSFYRVMSPPRQLISIIKISEVAGVNKNK